MKELYNNELIKELDDSPQTNFSISINNDSINSFTTIENILNYFQKSNLKVDKIIKTSHMFSGCISLISLPDLSTWNNPNINFINALH